ncbi:hypothetical protein [Pedosphaera parvula]|uniref:Uncharacterized protein n=1 Tax=Pedosphaera parvula (strain Ellin514) TaxID=320771 RepID=B9XJV4_PEDPL|nr:hypothetical protein [Pedosphaera parvula]EEF59777.1 hypothetical protein Cflav_PD2784 [Pedosphaera parvula Ellin514]
MPPPRKRPTTLLVQDEELPAQRTLPVQTAVMVEEAKLGCITAMLMCLDRRQRLAFILGEVLGETSETSAVETEAQASGRLRLVYGWA